MKINKQYTFLGIALLIYFLLTFTAKKTTDWNTHYRSNATSPYGTKAFHELLNDSDLGITIENVRLTSYEIYNEDNYQKDKNLMIISDLISLDSESLNSVLEEAKNGRTIFLAAESFSYALKDTLKFKTATNFDEIQIKNFDLKSEDKIIIDSVEINYNDAKAELSSFEFTSNIIEYDTLNSELFVDKSSGKAFLLKHTIGEGSVYICTVPKLFSNIVLLHNNNAAFLNDILKMLPEGEYIRSEFYNRGREGHSSPLRVVLTRDGVKESVYLLLMLIFIYFLFQSKREQRAIPIITPPINESIGFIKTISQLYIKKRDHKSILIKRKKYLMNHIRNKYQVNLNDDEINSKIELLSHRSGISEDELKALFIQLDKEIKHSSSANTFMKTNELIDDFYTKEI
ncbi:DUF4350 domain-containing protein [Flammeovirga pacifica]|uniref:DUF4350 domain-containing protein n=1 Tax=Flammeovirga pacifica TaxID=915059 RepID=A0A1S1YUL6_FLAPC|nr:DUF4350 domain-containing protein [Flammeovirga pacifica]OHX64711.1 hypothetical protein NH26_24420 [Flammeovirga pacifica]